MHNTRSFSTSTVDLRAHCWTMNAHAQHPFLFYFDCGLYSMNKTQSPSAFRVAVSSSPSKSDSATPSRQTGRRSPGCHRRSYLSSSGFTAVLFLLFCFCCWFTSTETTRTGSKGRPPPLSQNHTAPELCISESTSNKRMIIKSVEKLPTRQKSTTIQLSVVFFSNLSRNYPSVQCRGTCTSGKRRTAAGRVTVHMITVG